MLFEDSRWRKLSKLMAHHVFGHKDRVKNLSVMNQERVADEIGGNRRAAGPGLDRLLATGVVQLLDLLDQMQFNERALL